MRKHFSTMLLGLILVAFGFLWFASGQGWIQFSSGLVLAIGVMLMGLWVIVRALMRR